MGHTNSAVDPKAQTDVVLNPIFVNYINRTQSIRTIDEIFSKKRKKKIRKKMESEGNVH